VLAEEWQRIGAERERVIGELARAMVDRKTDLVAVNVLAYALATAGEDGLTELLPLLSHETFWIRAYAAEGLGSLDNRARWAVPALCQALSACISDWTAYTIMRALGNIGGDDAMLILQAIGRRARSAQTPDKHLIEAIEAALAAAYMQL